MQCYAIKSGTEYLADVNRPVSCNYDEGPMVSAVNDLDDAKHYTNKSQAKSWIKRTIASMNKIIDDIDNIFKHDKMNPRPYHNAYRTNHLNRKKDTATIVRAWLQVAVIEPVDIEHPSYTKDKRIAWDKWRVTNNTQGKSKMHIETNTVARHSCRSCGLKLKNIPYYEIDDRIRVCIPCLYIRQSSINAAFESMDTELRESITTELILGNL